MIPPCVTFATHCFTFNKKVRFIIGAEGMVAPCMGMADCEFAVNFPNLFETPLKEILRESELHTLTTATVKDIRDHNPKCRKCQYLDRCTGGCRNSVLIKGNDYYGIDEDLCYFFENGWEERLTKAAQKPFEEYLRRHPEIQENRHKKSIEMTAENCP